MQIDELPNRVTHAVEGLRDRAAGVVAPEPGSVFREIATVLRRIDHSERRLAARIDELDQRIDAGFAGLKGTKRQTTWPRRLFWLLVGAGVGMGAEYLADPDRGRSRRAQLSDQAGARARDVTGEVQKKAKMTVDRARGQVVESVKGVLPQDVPDDPKLLEQRIRSEVFGHRDDVSDVVLRIDAPGTVAIKGTVPSADSQRDLVSQVAEVDGVIDVRSELAVRSS